MIRKVLLVVLLAGASVTAGAATPTSASFAPTLSVTKGTVLVSSGSQFVTAKPGQVLKAGDRVMVMQGGSASVNYANGRSSALPAGTLSDVGASTAMTFGGQAFAASRKIGPMYAQAPGDKVCHDDNGKVVACGSAAVLVPTTSSMTPFLVAGIVAGAVAIAVTHNNNKSVSP